MELKPTSIPGCFEMRPLLRRDARGLFVKTFQAGFFREQGLNADFHEDFYTVSKKGVIRGMHFQAPPKAQDKLVWCIFGKILDVAVDLRQGSPTYGKHHTIQLSAENGNMLYIPVGLAHGFYAITEGAVVAYKVSEEYSPADDLGVRWDSLGISWPSTAAIISDRDRGFPTLAEFKSPFRYE